MPLRRRNGFLFLMVFYKEQLSNKNTDGLIYIYIHAHTFVQ